MISLCKEQINQFKNLVAVEKSDSCHKKLKAVKNESYSGELFGPRQSFRKGYKPILVKHACTI